MSKQKASKLDPFAERLEEWFLAGKTLAEAKGQLALDGCSVSLSTLSEWWAGRQSRRLQDRLLGQIASGARACQEVEVALGENGAPGLETLIKLHRVLILKLSTEGNADPEQLELVNRMMREVIKFARLEQLGKQNDLEERKLVLIERKAQQADAAKGLLQDQELSEEQRALKMRELFGL